MADKLGIHVTPDANPENITKLILELSENDLTFDNDARLLAHLSAQGIGSRSEITNVAGNMGITEKNGTQTRLSSLGLILSRAREEVRGDLLHFLMYTGWQPQQPKEFLQSWAYRQVCDQYWDEGGVELSSDYLNRLVGDIINRAEAEFAQHSVMFDSISFSRKSLTGAEKWLEGLNPAVIENKHFERRNVCHPEIMLLALGYAFRDDPDMVEIDVLLTPDKRETIARLCLMEPNSIDRTLDWSIPRYPDVITEGTKAGFYGRFLRIKRLPRWEDIVS